MNHGQDLHSHLHNDTRLRFLEEIGTTSAEPGLENDSLNISSLASNGTATSQIEVTNSTVNEDEKADGGQSTNSSSDSNATTAEANTTVPAQDDSNKTEETNSTAEAEDRCSSAAGSGAALSGWPASGKKAEPGCEEEDGSSQFPNANSMDLFKYLGQNYSKKVLLDHIMTKDDCLKYGGRWFLPERNFDNILSSLAVLFEIITTEGWMELMYMGVDTNGVNMQPKRNARPYFAIYFISFIIIGNIFLLNLLVGIVIDQFNRLKDRMCGYAHMTRDQREWVESEQQMTRLTLLR